MDWLIDLLKTPSAIKVYVVSHLCVAVTYDSARRYYKLYCNDEQQAKVAGRKLEADLKHQSGTNVATSRSKRSAASEEPAQSGWDWTHFPRISRYLIAYKRFSTVMMVYFLLKNSLPIILLYLVSFVREYWQVAGLDEDTDEHQNSNARMPDSCFLLGRLALSSSAALNHVTSALFSVYHLIWRFQGLFGLYQCHLELFMLQTDRDIEKFLQAYEQKSSSSLGDVSSSKQSKLWNHSFHCSCCSNWSMSSSPPSPSTSSSWLLGTSSIPALGTTTTSQQTMTMDRRRRDINTKTSCNSNSNNGTGSLTGYERLMRDIMFYKVDKPWGAVYRLRLNRTREARETLKMRLALNWIGSVTYFALVCLPVTYFILHDTLPDLAYCRRYPGCNQELDRLCASGSLGSWHMTWTAHRVISFAGDFVENFIVWVDSGSSLTYNTAICSLLNQDLLLCCERLQAKLEMFLKRAKLDYHKHQRRYQPQARTTAATEFRSDHFTTGIYHKSNARTRPPPPPIPYRFLRPPSSFLEACLHDSYYKQNHRILPDDGGRRAYYHASSYTTTTKLYPSDKQHQKSRKSPRQANSLIELGAIRDHTSSIHYHSIPPPASFRRFDEAMCELQMEIKDFFDQIASADQFYSTFLTTYIIIWFSTRSALSYYSLKVNKTDIPITVQLVQVFNFCSMSFLSWNAFKLHTGCMRACRLMCSLMAYDRSSYKRGFAKILDFYCNHKKCGYTLFHQYPYRPTTYLSIIGWSFSVFFIINSLFKYY